MRGASQRLAGSASPSPATPVTPEGRTMSRPPRPTLAMHALEEEPDRAAAACRNEGIGMEITTFAHPTNHDEGSDALIHRHVAALERVGLRPGESLRSGARQGEMAARTIHAHDGKGARDRIMTPARALVDPLERQLGWVTGSRSHHLDQRFGQVHLPHALHAHHAHHPHHAHPGT